MRHVTTEADRVKSAYRFPRNLRFLPSQKGNTRVRAMRNVCVVPRWGNRNEKRNPGAYLLQAKEWFPGYTK